MATVEKSYLDQLKSAIETNQVAAKSRAAGNWFRSLVGRARGAFSDETPKSILTRSESLTTWRGKSMLGKMYFYSYNPKWKDQLPWYDTFPLVFPIERYPDGFLGLNFHYLHPKHRRRYLREVKTFVVNEAKWKAAEEFCENKGFQWQILTEDTLTTTK